MPSLLLVEDDPCTAELVRRAFQVADLEVDVDVELVGEVALERLRHAATAGGVPDLVLLDLRPVGMDGTRVLRGIRSCPGLEDLAVVVYTGSVLASDERAARAAGADDFFVKPDSFMDLVDRLVSMAGQWLAGRPLAVPSGS